MFEHSFDCVYVVFTLSGWCGLEFISSYQRVESTPKVATTHRRSAFWLFSAHKIPEIIFYLCVIQFLCVVDCEIIENGGRVGARLSFYMCMNCVSNSKVHNFIFIQYYNIILYNCVSLSPLFCIFHLCFCIFLFAGCLEWRWRNGSMQILWALYFGCLYLGRWLWQQRHWQQRWRCDSDIIMVYSIHTHTMDEISRSIYECVCMLSTWVKSIGKYGET